MNGLLGKGYYERFVIYITDYKELTPTDVIDHGVILQKLIVAQLVTKRPGLCGIQRFLTAFIAACHWTLP